LKRHPVRYFVLFCALILLLGFAFTRVGPSSWDAPADRQYMQWPIGNIKWCGFLREYILVVFTGALRLLREPLWVRHAVTFILLPSIPVGVYLLLRNSGESRHTALLSVAVLSSNPRLSLVVFFALVATGCGPRANRPPPPRLVLLYVPAP